jgi:NADH dehydrogenase
MITVTGAFNFTGRYIAKELLRSGERVQTLTNHPERDPFGGGIPSFPLDFSDPEKLIRILQGSKILFNTYWVRYQHGEISHQLAVKNIKILVDCALRAGVKRLVHLSVTNPSLDTNLPYFKGKAEAEELIKRSGISYAIIRPSLIFGLEDVLINNIAWLIRHFPFFPVFNQGEAWIQPIFAEDNAKIAVEAGFITENLIWDSVGSERFTFAEIVRMLAKAQNRKIWTPKVPNNLTLALSQIIGLFQKDHLLTRDEMIGLLEDRLISNDVPRGTTLFSRWIIENSGSLGTKYLKDFNRYYR